MLKVSGAVRPIGVVAAIIFSPICGFAKVEGTGTERGRRGRQPSLLSRQPLMRFGSRQGIPDVREKTILPSVLRGDIRKSHRNLTVSPRVVPPLWTAS